MFEQQIYIASKEYGLTVNRCHTWWKYGVWMERTSSEWLLQSRSAVTQRVG